MKKYAPNEKSLTVPKRYKNPYFLLGIIGVALTGMGISPEMLTSWEVLGNSLKGLVGNPFMLCTVIMSIVGVFVDPTTKGIRDCKQG